MDIVKEPLSSSSADGVPGINIDLTGLLSELKEVSADDEASPSCPSSSVMRRRISKGRRLEGDRHHGSEPFISFDTF